MSKGERLRGHRYVEQIMAYRFRNYTGKPGPNNPDHVCLIDNEAKSTEACKVCRGWWEPTGDGGWVKVNRAQKRARLKAFRKAWTNAAREA